jgi:tetratricopeptide (TPR) repeat protein
MENQSKINGAAMCNSSVISVSTVFVLLLMPLACSDQPTGDAAQAIDDTYGEQLGSVSFPVSCSEPAAASVLRGVPLLHNMTYLGAETYFARAIDADPQCAMAYWGLAMTYVHPLWPDAPPEAQFADGLDLLTAAQAIDNKTPREAAYIDAVAAYYRDGVDRTEAERLTSFEAGWKRVYEEYPDDPEAAAFYALALMATAGLGEQGSAIRTEAGQIVEDVLAEVPNHPGAHHYIIHAYDTPSFADKALAVARNYGKVAPDVPHALHMPTHIFTRLGLWPESIDWNSRSAAAALTGLNADIISSEYLHALDYLVYAYLQIGADDKAAELVELVQALEGPYGQMSRSPSAYALAAIPARYALERRQWADAAALEARVPASFPWDDSYAPYEALSWFAIGIGAARNGDSTGAGRAAMELQRLHDLVQEAGNAYWAMQIEVQRLAVEAWRALADGNSDQALQVMQQAADLEASTDKHAVTPGELLPAQELLGDMLLEFDQPAAALTAYQTALVRSPNRFNAIYGAAVAAEAIGNAAQARDFYQALSDMCADADTERPRLAATRARLADTGDPG